MWSIEKDGKIFGINCKGVYRLYYESRDVEQEEWVLVLIDY